MRTRIPLLLGILSLLALLLWGLRPGSSNSQTSRVTNVAEGERALPRAGMAPEQVRAGDRAEISRQQDPLEQMLHQGHLIEALENVPPMAGEAPGSRRIEIYRTSFRYPLVRVERDADGGIIGAMVADHLLVRRLPGVTHEDFVAHVTAAGLEIRRRLFGDSGYLITSPGEALPGALEAIAMKLSPSAPGSPVGLCEPDPIASICLVPNDPSFPGLTGLNNSRDADIDAPEAWDIATDAPDVVVAVIDTGIDIAHEDLAANIWTNPGEIPGNNIDDDGNGLIDDIHGFDFYNDDAAPADDNQHGTHCAGTIGAAGNNSIGVTGVAWSVKMMPLKAFDAMGTGAGSAILESIVYASQMGARVTSNSYTSISASVARNDAIEAAGEAGCLHIAAAGNNGRKLVPQAEAGAHSYVASAGLDHVLTVAATDSYDNLASFSNYGDSVVDLAAPGVNVQSTLPGNAYGALSGTSMAAPHVAGACALLLGQRPGLTSLEVKQQALASADRLPSLAGKVITGGRLNLRRMISGLSDQAPVITSAASAVATFGSAFSYQINATNFPSDYAATGLPAGLSLDRDTGVISGIAAETGEFTVVLRASNIAGDGSLELALTVVLAPPVITSAASASGAVYAAFQHKIVASGGVTEFSASGLPAGLTIDTVSGLISGHPLTGGEFDVVITATNPLGSASQTLHLSIGAASAPVFLNLAPRSAVAGEAWSLQVEADSLPTRYGATGLPDGLSINTGTGLISGTPVAIGSYPIALEAENPAGIGHGQFTLTVNPESAPVMTVPASLSLTVGQPFNFTLTATHNPDSFNASGLPSGLALGEGGVISGTPLNQGFSLARVSATNASGTGSATIRMLVGPAAPVITSPLAATLMEGQPFLYEITASGGATAFDATNLPAGLSLIPGTARIAGTVNTAGVYQIQLSATNAGGTGTAMLALTVNPRVPVITSALEAFVGAGSPFSYRVTTDIFPATLSTGALPAGLSFDAGTGEISGSVTSIGVYPITLFAKNAGGTGTAVLQLTVHQGETRITSFTPAQVAPGGLVTIDGVGFTGATQVYFSDRNRNLVAASSFTVQTDGRIRATVPYLKQAYEGDYSWIIVISPRGLAVTLPASTVQVSSGYDLGGGGGRYALVHQGGALVTGGGGGARVVVERGASASLQGGGGGHTLFVDGGGFLDVTGGGATTIFRSPGAILLNEASLESVADIREVPSVRATIVPDLLRVLQVPVVTSPAAVSTVIGQAFSYQLQTDGMMAGVETFALTGTLPPGLSFSADTGVISGFAYTPGVYNPVVQVTNSQGTTNFALQITVTGAAIPVITSSTRINGATGAFLSYQIAAANSPSSYGASGLPAGLGLNAATGVISGTPSTGGVFTATLSATNAAGTGQREVTFVIGISPLAINSFSPQTVASGAPVQLTGRGFTNVQQVYFLSRDKGLKADLGRTVASDTQMSVLVPPLSDFGSSEQSPIIAVTAERSTVTFPSGAFRYNSSGTTGGSGGMKIIVSPGATVTLGGGGGYLIYVEAGGTLIAGGGGGGHVVFLEDGATLNGYVSAVLRSPGSILLNQQGSGTTTLVPSLSLSMLPNNSLLNVFQVPVITSGNATGTIGSPFNYATTLLHDDFMATFSATGLPAGLAMSTDTGLITGTPTVTGTFAVTLSATGRLGTGTKVVQITIGGDTLPRLSVASRVDGSVSTPVDVQLAAVNGPVTYTATGLPAGFTLSGSGRLTGNASSAGVWTASLTLTNSSGSTAMKYVVAIGSPQPVISTISPFTSMGQLTSITGTGLGQVTRMVFKEGYSELGVDGTAVSVTATTAQAITPQMNLNTNMGAIVSVFANGGVALALPQTMERISSTSGIWTGGQHVCLGSGATGHTYGSGSHFVYVEAGGTLVMNGGGGQVIYAEDGATVQILGGAGGDLVAAPNAIVLGAGNEMQVTRVAGLRATLVPDYLKFSAIPVITSASQTRGYREVPFFFPVQAVNSPTNYTATGLPPGLTLHPTTGAISGNPTLAGNFTATIKTTNAAGIYTAALVFTIGGPVDYWQESQFAAFPGGVADPMAADDADADRDGIPNLLEYAAKLDPKLPGAVKVATSLRVNGELRFAFRRLKGAGTGSTAAGYVVSGIRYVVESSANLSLWATGPERFEQTGSPVDNGDGTETVTVRVLGSGNKFVRLRVERAPLN